MPSGKFEGILIVVKQRKNQENDFVLRVRSSLREGRCLRIVEIRYVRTPDADERLSRAVNILLASAARGAAKSEGSINAKKEELPHQAPAEDTLTGGDEESDSHE